MLEKINKPIKLRKEKQMSFTDDEVKNFTNMDLEQEILSCWGIIEDLNIVSQAKTLENALNIIESLKDIYGYKFERCFHVFEEMLRSKRNY